MEDVSSARKAKGPKSTKSRKAQKSTRVTLRRKEPESTPVTFCEKENMFLSRYNHCKEFEENRLNFCMRVALDPLLLTSSEGQGQLGCFVTPTQEPSAMLSSTMSLASRIMGRQLQEDAEPVTVEPARQAMNDDDTSAPWQIRWKRLVLWSFVAIAHATSGMLLHVKEKIEERLVREAEEELRRVSGSSASSQQPKNPPKTKSNPKSSTRVGKADSLSLSKSSGFRMNPEDCPHMPNDMICRGNGNAYWWTCKGCGSRWNRIEKAPPVKSAPAQPTHPPPKTAAVPAKNPPSLDPPPLRLPPSSQEQERINLIDAVIAMAPNPKSAVLTMNAMNLLPPAKAPQPSVDATNLPVLNQALLTTSSAGQADAQQEEEFEIVQPCMTETISPLTTATHALLSQTHSAYVASGMDPQDAWTAAAQALASQAQGFPDQEQALREALNMVMQSLAEGTVAELS